MRNEPSATQHKRRPVLLYFTAPLILLLAAIAVFCWPHRERLAAWHAETGLVASARPALTEYFPERHKGATDVPHFLGLLRFGTAEQVAAALGENPGLAREAQVYLEKSGQGTLVHRVALGVKDQRIAHAVLRTPSVNPDEVDSEGRTALRVATAFCPDPALVRLITEWSEKPGQGAGGNTPRDLSPASFHGGADELLLSPEPRYHIHESGKRR